MNKRHEPDVHTLTGFGMLTRDQKAAWQVLLESKREAYRRVELAEREVTRLEKRVAYLEGELERVRGLVATRRKYP